MPVRLGFCLQMKMQRTLSKRKPPILRYSRQSNNRCSIRLRHTGANALVRPRAVNQDHHPGDLMKNNTITPATQLCAVIGNPIGHSLSPALHNAAFDALGLDFVYVAFRVEDLKSALG